jgi:hypothetical protein
MTARKPFRHGVKCLVVPGAADEAVTCPDLLQRNLAPRSGPENPSRLRLLPADDDEMVRTALKQVLAALAEKVVTGQK